MARSVSRFSEHKIALDQEDRQVLDRLGRDPQAIADEAVAVGAVRCDRERIGMLDRATSRLGHCAMTALVADELVTFACRDLECPSQNNILSEQPRANTTHPTDQAAGSFMDQVLEYHHQAAAADSE